MTDPKSLGDSRYLELLERVVFSGHYSLSVNTDRQIHDIQNYGRSFGGANSGTGPAEVELWEAEDFRVRAGDLRHELGPSSLTDHLRSLTTRTTNFELKRFFARTQYCEYPKYPAEYRIPIRTLDGQLHCFNIQWDTTQIFGSSRDVTRWNVYNACGWPQNLPPDFEVPSDVVTCVRSLEAEELSYLVVGLGRLINPGHGKTGFILVWFLDKGKLGLVYDYTDPANEFLVENGKGHRLYNSNLKGEFIGSTIKFSMATLEGDYRLGDGRNPTQELSTQLDQDITLSLEPFAYDGFTVEDACRHRGVIQSLSQDLVTRVNVDGGF